MREDALVSFSTFSYVEELARRRMPVVARRAFVASVLHVAEAWWSASFA